MNKEDILTEAGLTNWESKVYRKLLEIGELTTGPLAQKSGVPQSKIYMILGKLQEKGLISHIVKGKVKHFQAQDPNRIYNLFKEKEEKIKKEVSQLNGLKRENESNSVQLVEGFKAIRAINIEIVREAKRGTEFYGYSEGIYSKEVNEIYHQFGELRRIAGIKEHLLISKNNKELFEKSILKEDLSYVKKKTKYSNISFPQDTAIFRDCIIMYRWSEIPQAIVIKSKDLAEHYKKFFIDLWESASS